jgi:phosphopantetheine--protein transferase-like protein
MEAQGAGMQIIMTARLAIAMGAPIYGVVALSSTATDKNGRSIPAPGQGVLTSARELTSSTNLSYPSSVGQSSTLSGLASSSPQSLAAASSLSSPLLTVSYRKRRLAEELAGIVEWRSKETSLIAAEAADVASEAAAEHVSSSSSSTSTSQDVAATELDKVGRNAVEQFTSARLAHIAREAALLEASARRRWCCDFWQRDPSVSPIRGALAVFGLSVDDITISYFHGTGTHANDLNESEVTHAQMAHLGRTEGQPLYVVAQKYLTGHPKGAAAAWMVNGSLQSINSGIVPGNKNAEDIDEELRGFHHLAYLSQPLRLGEGGVRACLVKSFGFGQAGGEILLVHPDYLLASLDSSTYSEYADRRAQRELVSQRHAQEVLGGRKKLVGVKAHPPYTKAQEHRVYLDPTARVQQDKITGEYSFVDSQLRIGSSSTSSSTTTSSSSTGSSVPVWKSLMEQQMESKNSAAALALASTVHDAATSSLFNGEVGASSSSSSSSSSASSSPPLGVGVDVEPLSTFSSPSETFIQRNFTPSEISYCKSAPNQVASFAGRWAAKEAVAKAISSAASATLGAGNFTLPGGGASLVDIEVIATTVPVGTATTTTTSGAPQTRLSGNVAILATRAGVQGIKLTISHSGEYAVAVAVVF